MQVIFLEHLWVPRATVERCWNKLLGRKKEKKKKTSFCNIG